MFKKNLFKGVTLAIVAASLAFTTGNAYAAPVSTPATVHNGDQVVKGNLAVKGDQEIKGNLTVSKSVKSKFIHADNNVSADLDVSAGYDVKAGRNVVAENDVKANKNVEAGIDVKAGFDVKAGRNVVAENDVKANKNVEAGIDVKAGYDVKAGKDIVAGQDVTAGRNIFVGKNATIGGTLKLGGIDNVEKAINNNKLAVEEEKNARVAEDRAIRNDFAAADSALNGRIDKLDGRLDRVGALAVAMAGMHPLGYDPEARTEVSMAGGSYGGETAYAAGIFHHPNEDVLLNFGMSICGSDKAGNIGATFRLGRHRK